MLLFFCLNIFTLIVRTDIRFAVFAFVYIIIIITNRNKYMYYRHSVINLNIINPTVTYAGYTESRYLKRYFPYNATQS